ncbi:MAG: type II secretion system protein J [Rubripirellula sp.]
MTGALRNGFTLLEVLLTLAMSVVLMGLISAALQFYARDMDASQMDIRQTQLAAALMQMIEDDLRATLHTQPVDTAGLEALLAASTGGEAAPAGGGEDLSAAGIDSEETMIEDVAAVDLQTGVAVLQTPGLIGNQFQIQLDLSRLPRLEEYVAYLDEDTSDIDDVPSDLKTVAYFVQPSGTGVQDTLMQLDPGASLDDSGGMVRRSLDRAATVEAANNGNLTLLNQTGELLAPEVASIEFSYWDGLTWQLEWSSDEYGELPLAVQVTIAMNDPDAGLVIGEAPRTFTHIVRLPLAQPIEEEEDSLSGAAL